MSEESVSNCCTSTYHVVKGNGDRVESYATKLNPGETYHWQCDKCGKACDLKQLEKEQGDE